MKLVFIITAAASLVAVPFSAASAIPSKTLERRGYFGINIMEFNFCRQWANFSRCWSCFLDKGTAKTASEEDFDAWSLNESGDGDAFRHCYWSALMVLSTDLAFSKTIGDLHENGDTQQSAKVKQMDLLNNEIGRTCGSAAKASNMTDKGAAAYKCCYDKAKAWPSMLYVLKRTMYAPELPAPKCCTLD